MSRLRLVLVVVCATATEAGTIFYPSELRHDEHGACDTKEGTPGTCERSCGPSADESKLQKCAIKDAAFLYCCETLNTFSMVDSYKTIPSKITAGFQNVYPPLNDAPGDALSENNVRIAERTTPDTSPPSVTFECGINSKNTFVFNLGGGDALMLRPEAVTPPSIDVNVTIVEPPSIEVNVTIDEPLILPGIPMQAFIDYLNVPPPPEGAYSVAHGIVAEKNSWPWMALLGKEGKDTSKWFCGGVLINEQWVLSALHCFFNHVASVVRLGEHDYMDYSEGAQYEDFNVEKTVFFPDFKRPLAYHDLALLKLSSKVTFKDHIAPVCLPWGGESDSVMINQTATISGWGDTEYGGFPSSILQEANLTVFTADHCDSSYSNLPHYRSTWPEGIKQETLCAGDPEGGRDACQGDSGGPLVSQDSDGRYVLAGIVSRGYGCGHKDYPGLYANLRHPPYLAWVKEIAFGTE